MDCEKIVKVLKDSRESIDMAIAAIESGDSLEVYHQLAEIKLDCSIVESELRR